jgi:hypothetical protein
VTAVGRPDVRLGSKSGSHLVTVPRLEVDPDGDQAAVDSTRSSTSVARLRRQPSAPGCPRSPAARRSGFVVLAYDDAAERIARQLRSIRLAGANAAMHGGAIEFAAGRALPAPQQGDNLNAAQCSSGTERRRGRRGRRLRGTIPAQPPRAQTPYTSLRRERFPHLTGDDFVPGVIAFAWKIDI